MNRTKVGVVTPEECAEIQKLFERKNGLQELAKIMHVDNEELYEKLVKDMGETSTKYQQWWDKMSIKYSWPSCADGHWEIDFNSFEIFLVK